MANNAFLTKPLPFGTPEAIRPFIENGGSRFTACFRLAGAVQHYNNHILPQFQGQDDDTLMHRMTLAAQNLVAPEISRLNQAKKQYVRTGTLGSAFGQGRLEEALTLELVELLPFYARRLQGGEEEKRGALEILARSAETGRHSTNNFEIRKILGSRDPLFRPDGA